MGRGQALGSVARRLLALRLRQRAWALGLLFVGPLLFMLHATARVGSTGLHQWRPDLQFAQARGALLRYRLGGASRAAAAAAAAGGSSSIGGGELATGGRRRMVRRLIATDDGAAAAEQQLEGAALQLGASSSWAHLQEQQGRVQELRRVAHEPQVWLYTLLGADYEGTAELLPHWLGHYLHTLGFSRERLLLVVNHNSSRPEAQAELAAVQRVLAAWGIEHQLWAGRYSSDAHLKVKLQLLQQRVGNMEDWVVIADSDEFHTYPGAETIRELLAGAERHGSNWVLGQMVDRVAVSGELAPVQAEPSLFEQFPLNCHVVRHVSRGSVWKVVAAKAYWRTNTGNHYVVEPDRARDYFGGAAPGVKNPRGGWFGAEDLWPLTPYATVAARYQSSDSGGHAGLWQLSQHPGVVPVFHFKWHQGVLQSAADRYEHYSGNVSQPGGHPRYKHYGESRNILQALADGRIDLEAAQCSREPPVLSERTPQQGTPGLLL